MTPRRRPSERDEIVRRVFRTVVRRVALANAAGIAVVGVYQNVISPPLAASNTEAEIPEWAIYAAGSVYLGASAATILWWARRTFEPTRRWLEEQRPPTAAERDAVLAWPASLTSGLLALWVTGAVLAGSGPAWGEPARAAFSRFAGVTLGGVTTSLLTFLLIERTLRPVYALALTTGPSSAPRTLGVRPRLLLSWALGSAVPVVALMLGPVGRVSATGRDLRGLIWFLGATAIVAGGSLIIVAARSVAEPIDAVRAGLKRVQEGATDVRIDVDDGGELGLLQSGFNEMVAGLRERQRLQDLFGRHVGEEVARQALARGVGLRGEQREASALFVDLVGSTALASTRPAAEVVDMLNALFETVVRVSSAYAGWVNKFEGDAALCIFGAPADQPDHAALALRAARALRAELFALVGRFPELDAGIGVSSGPVVAGNVGAEARYEYTVIGDAVNEAARLTDVAKTTPARVVASGGAVERAGAEARCWEQFDVVQLRGRAHLTVAYRPVAG